jgi:hypothetical protein
MLGRRAALAGAAALCHASAAVRAQDDLTDLARRAALYLYPLREMYRARWNDTVTEGQRLNRLRRLAPAIESGTLDCTAWLDLSAEPMFLTLPAMGERSYCIGLFDFFGDNFACVSRRLHGAAPPPHMIAGPGWTADAPSDVVLLRAQTNAVWLRGFILISDTGNLEGARLQQARTLIETPDMHNERRILEIGELSRMRTYPPFEALADWPRSNPANPFDLFEVGLRVLGESPLPQRDTALFEEMAPLRLRPGRKFDARAFSAAERQAIIAGIAMAEAEIRTRPDRVINGWTSHEHDLGAFVPAEVMTLSCEVDGTNRHRLRFDPDDPPPVRAVRTRQQGTRFVVRFYEPQEGLIDGSYGVPKVIQA